MVLRELFSRRWIVATVLVVAGVWALGRLGIWQLDRLGQRRALNTRIIEQAGAPELVLDEDAFDLDLYNMEYRHAKVTGSYDFSQQISLRNQAANGVLGVHLITPLIIEGTDQAVLVNRGWIPLEDTARENWGQYDEAGLVEVKGLIRRSQNQPQLGMLPDPTLQPGENSLDTWSMVYVERIDEQIDGSLLPVYVQQMPEGDNTDLPIRSQPYIEITDGPHLGYALQWFTFSLMLAVGYPVYVKKYAQPLEEQNTHE